jgi:hypothetical protein
MCLEYDGLDKRWSRGINWATMDGQHDDVDIAIFRNHRLRVGKVTDFSYIGIDDKAIPVHMAGVEEVEGEHEVLKSKLIVHFNAKYANREIEWLR